MSSSGPENKDTNMPSEQQENWDCYLISTDDGPVLNFLNLSARSTSDNNLVIRSLVRIKLNQPDEHGFPTKEEDIVLWKIEDALETYVQKSLGGRYVGRSTHKGQRTFCYYVSSDNQLKDSDLQVILARFGGYAPQCSSEKDDKWTYYFEVLYPSAEQMQCIQNRKVVDQLVKSGDLLEELREIDHWIFFKSSEGRQEYKNAVMQMGFEIRQERQLDDGRYSLQIYREDLADYESIDEIVLPLFRLARKQDADYDGWETLVVKEQ